MGVTRAQRWEPRRVFIPLPPQAFQDAWLLGEVHPSNGTNGIKPAIPRATPLYTNVSLFTDPSLTPQVSTFIMMYRTHCQRILDTVIRANFDEVGRHRYGANALLQYCTSHRSYFKNSHQVQGLVSRSPWQPLAHPPFPAMLPSRHCPYPCLMEVIVQIRWHWISFDLTRQ